MHTSQTLVLVLEVEVVKVTHTVLEHTVVRRSVLVLGQKEGAVVVGTHISLLLLLMQEGVAVKGIHTFLTLVLVLALV